MWSYLCCAEISNWSCRLVPSFRTPQQGWCRKGVLTCCFHQGPPPWDLREALHANLLTLGMSSMEGDEYVSRRGWLVFELVAFFNVLMSWLLSFFLAAHKSNNTKANSSTGYVSENQMDFPSVAFARMSFFFRNSIYWTNRKEEKEKIFFLNSRQNIMKNWDNVRARILF